MMPTEPVDLDPPAPSAPARPPQGQDRNWAGWYAQGEDYVFEQNSYDLRSPALMGLAGLAVSLAVVLWLVADGPPGSPVANAVYGGLLVISLIALMGSAIAARALLQPVRRTARLSWRDKAVHIDDELAVGLVRRHSIPLAQVVQARLRGEKALAAPEGGPAQRDHLLAYPVSQVELELRRDAPYTLTTGALLSAVAARRCVDNLNAYLRKRPPEPEPAAAAPQPAAPAARVRADRLKPGAIRPLPQQSPVEMPAGWNAHRPRRR